MMRIRALCYDWDGVIQNSMPEMYKGVLAVFAAEGVEPPTLEYYCQRLTAPFEEWFHRHGIRRQSDAEWIALFHSVINTEFTPLFQGVAASLDRIRQKGVKTAIVSAAPIPFIESMILRHGLMDSFDMMISGLASKAMALRAVCATLKVPCHETAYVGDLISDVKSAKEAGLKAVAFVGPHGHESVFHDLEPDRVVRSHAEIADALFP